MKFSFRVLLELLIHAPATDRQAPVEEHTLPSESMLSQPEPDPILAEELVALVRHEPKALA